MRSLGPGADGRASNSNSNSPAANYHPVVSKIMGFGYMIFAVLVHWDHFTFSRYHLNHHYLVTKNYGSHWPLFDMFFNTYQWEPFELKDRYE